jgi:hypothetical protein
MAKDGDWWQCPGCRLRVQPSVPTEEQRAETAAAFRAWRHLLSVVGQLHNLGYEQARIVPFIVDTPGGGDWQCAIAPARFLEGAGTDSVKSDFPHVIGRGWRGYQPMFASAATLLRAFPRLAELCLCRDRAYVEWYRDMLRLTAPDGVVYAWAYWDRPERTATDPWRVLRLHGGVETSVPPPPPVDAENE